MGNLACCADDEALNTAPGKLGLTPIKRLQEQKNLNYSVESKEKDKSNSMKDVENDPSSSKTSSEAGFYLEDMTDYKWDGPEDPDIEIEELIKLKS